MHIRLVEWASGGVLAFEVIVSLLFMDANHRHHRRYKRGSDAARAKAIIAVSRAVERRDR